MVARHFLLLWHGVQFASKSKGTACDCEAASATRFRIQGQKPRIASEAPASVQLEEAADKSDSQIGPATETDVEHLARHGGGRDGCARCKLPGCGCLQ